MRGRQRRGGRRFGGQPAEDPARQPGKAEQQVECRVREDAVVVVILPHHRMTQPIGRARELDRHVGHLLEPVELASVMQDALGRAGSGQPVQVIMQHDPLVMPGHDLAGLLEKGAALDALRRQQVHDRVVELEESQMRPGDDQVLVIAVIADQCLPLGAARQVVAELARDIAEAEGDVAPEQQLRRRLSGGGVAGMKMRTAIWPRP